MTEGLGFSEEQQVDFVACALLHDNAVAEYLNEKNTVQNFLGQSENIQAFDFTQFARHAYLGERNAELLPFRTDVKNIILWHHENADGSGAFGLTQNQTNMRSEILHLADTVDLLFNLKAISSDDFDHISEFIQQESGRLFSDRSAARFLETLSFTDIRCMQEKGRRRC